MSFRESALVKYGPNVIYRNIGTSVSVDFDFLSIWENYKEQDIKSLIFGLNHPDPRCLHFVHVHPYDYEHPSVTDEICIRGLNIAFGYPVMFSIVRFFYDTSLHDNIPIVSRFQFFNNKWQRTFLVGNFVLTKEELIWLDLASRGLANG